MEVKKKRSRAMQCVTFLLILLYGSTNMGGGAEDVPIFSGSNSAEATGVFEIMKPIVEDFTNAWPVCVVFYFCLMKLILGLPRQPSLTFNENWPVDKESTTFMARHTNEIMATQNMPLMGSMLLATWLRHQLGKRTKCVTLWLSICAMGLMKPMLTLSVHVEGEICNHCNF